jgi:hypothetical protein
MFVAAVCAKQGPAKDWLQAACPHKHQGVGRFLLDDGVSPCHSRQDSATVVGKASAFIHHAQTRRFVKLSERWGHRLMEGGSMENEPRRKQPPRYLMLRRASCYIPHNRSLDVHARHHNSQAADLASLLHVS